MESMTSLFSVSLGPISGNSIVFFPFTQVLIADVRDQRAIWIAIRHQGVNRQQQFGNCQGGRPGIIQNVNPNLTVKANVAVVNLGTKSYL